MASLKLRPAVIAVIALCFCLSSVFVAPQAHAADVDDEQLFVQLINELRASKGLTPLQVDAQLTQASKSWADQMNSSDSLGHSPDLAAGISHDWSVLGENVGVHGIQGPKGVTDLFDAFVASPVHYQNIVDPRFQYLGVGVSYDNTEGEIWTTHRFMKLNSSSSPTTSQPTTTSTTLPQSTTTATTSSTRPPTTRPTTSRPTTSRPTTSRPTTTTRPTTTRPTTTRPATANQSSTSSASSAAPPTQASPATAQGPSDVSSSPPNQLSFSQPIDETQPAASENRFTKPELLQFLIEGFGDE